MLFVPALCSMVLLVSVPVNSECGLGKAELYTEWIGQGGLLKFPKFDDPEPSRVNTLCRIQSSNESSGCRQKTELEESRCLNTSTNATRNGTDNHCVPGLSVQFSNAMDHIPPDTFTGLSIGKLRIESGSLHQLLPETFRGIRNLQTLSITDNDIRAIRDPDRIFSDMRKLKALRLEDINMTLHVATGRSRKVVAPELGNLQLLSLAGNPLTNLHQDAFEWLRNSNIVYLNLQRCFVMEADPGFLKSIIKTLLYLDFGGSTFMQNRGDTYQKDSEGFLRQILFGLRDEENELSYLEGLGLANLNIVEVPSDLLDLIKDSLKYLSLNSNLMTVIRSSYLQGVPETSLERPRWTRQGFPSMPELIELDIRNCGVQTLEEGAFDNLPRLRVLLLANNEIVNILPGGFRNAPELRFLDLSRNKHDNSQEGYNLDRLSLRGKLNLTILDMSYSSVVKLSRSSLANLGPNLQRLSFCYSDLHDIEASTFKDSTQLLILDLSGNKIVKDRISPTLFEGLTGVTEFYLNNCGIDLLSNPNQDEANESLKHLTSLKYLTLANNALSKLYSSTFRGLANLEILKLSNNHITWWNESVISSMARLEKLDLQENSIGFLTDVMLSDFQNLDAIAISENPFVCGTYVCPFVNLFLNDYVNNTITGKSSGRGRHVDRRDIVYENDEYCNSRRGRQVTKELPLKTKLRCFDTETLERVRFIDYKNYTNSDCSKSSTETETFEMPTTADPDYSIPIYVSISVVVLIVILGGVVYHKWLYLRHFAQIIRNATIISFMDNEDKLIKEERVFIYDVFVSYSDPNREWVLSNLLANLENNSDIKVCLHERDFQVGLTILENITACMDKSRCVLLVLSTSFLKSHWCQFELHLAQHRLMETKREELILVLLEDIPKSKRSKMLTYLMMTKTYLVWPKGDGDEEAKRLFWKRLRRSVKRKEYVSVV